MNSDLTYSLTYSSSHVKYVGINDNIVEIEAIK